MQSNNPILSRYEAKPGRSGQSGGPGFAYEEGRSALGQATGQAPTATIPTASTPMAGSIPLAAAGGAVPPADTEAQFQAITAAGGARVTINDVIVKTAGVFAVTVVFAIIGWNVYPVFPLVMIGSLLIGLVLGLVNAFMKTVRPVLVVLYAVFQGLMLGAISNVYNVIAQGSDWNGIVLQAVIATMTTFAVMLILYVTGVVKVTKKFQSVMLVALVSYLVLGIASLIAGLLGVGGGWGFYGVSGIGIIIAVVGVLIAAFFLLLDFEAIKQGIAAGAPERESWRMAFGLLVTIIWLYMEFLRLLAIFSRN